MCVWIIGAGKWKGEWKNVILRLFDWSTDIAVAAPVQSNYPEYIIIRGDVGLFA